MQACQKQHCSLKSIVQLKCSCPASQFIDHTVVSGVPRFSSGALYMRSETCMINKYWPAEGSVPAVSSFWSWFDAFSSLLKLEVVHDISRFMWGSIKTSQFREIIIKSSFLWTLWAIIRLVFTTKCIFIECVYMDSSLLVLRVLMILRIWSVFWLLHAVSVDTCTVS